MKGVKALTGVQLQDADAGNPPAHQSVHALIGDN